MHSTHVSHTQTYFHNIGKTNKMKQPNKMNIFIENVNESHSTQTAFNSFCRHPDERRIGRTDCFQYIDGRFEWFCFVVNIKTYVLVICHLAAHFGGDTAELPHNGNFTSCWLIYVYT